MSARLDVDVALEVAHHEAIVRQAYRDSVGVWTWSVGLTSASGHQVERYIGNPQPLERCLAVWIWALRRYATAVEEALPGLAKHEFAAALSFHWNTGAIARASWARHWRRGDRGAARRAFMNWRKPPEIVPRRRAERDLFFDGRWSNDGAMTEWTRVRPDGRVDWSSAQRLDVCRALAAALA